MNTIKIQDTEYKLKYTIRALFIFERIADSSFEGKQLLDYYILFYSILLANNPDDFKLTFDELIDECDNDTSLFPSFLQFLNKEFEVKNQLRKNEEKEDGNDIKKK